MTKRQILSDADVESLFQTQNISDIKKFNNALERDIDRKREELRTTVGERYRDLMEAAETITHMKTTSSEVVDAFKNIAESTSKFDYYPSIQSIKYGSDANHKNDEEISNKDNFDQNDLAVAAEIKLLMDSPELMWSAVDNGDYLTAAQVFLFARHIHTNLTLQANSGQGKKLSSAFPIIERQWSSIMPFYDTILNGCTQLLSDESLSSDVELTNDEKLSEDINITTIIRSMAAMILLKGIKTKDLFTEFLRLREKSIKEKIFTEGYGAKVHIRRAITSLIFCIQSCAAFSPTVNANETIESVLQEVSEKPAISLFQNVSVSPVMKYLPSIIRDFCPAIVVKGEGNPASRTNTSDILDKEYLRTECTNWLDRVHDMISEGTSKVLSHVNTLGGLSMARTNTYDFLARIVSERNCNSSSEDWNGVCLRVLTRKVNIWNEFYRNLFRDRVEELILKEIEHAIIYLRSNLTSSIELNLDEHVAEFVWSEPNINENVLDHCHWKEYKKRSLTSLELKARSYSPSVQTICYRFDKILHALISDLSGYVDSGKSNKDGVVDEPFLLKASDLLESKANSDNSEKPFRLEQDNNAILEFVENAISSAVTQMLEDVHLQVEQELKSKLDESKFDERYVVMARICQAIPELSPSLEECSTASTHLFQRNGHDFYSENDYLGELKQLSIRTSKVANERHKKLKELNEKFINTCSFLLVSWITCLGIIMQKAMKTILSNDYEANLKLLPQWESVEISEEGEDGKQIKSNIRIPSQISVGLSQVLNQHVHAIYAIGSHNLPPKGLHSKITSIEIILDNQSTKKNHKT